MASPTLGKWYRNTYNDYVFEVVAIDDEDIIEIQYEDGDVEEIYLEDWGDIFVEAEKPK